MLNELDSWDSGFIRYMILLIVTLISCDLIELY